MDEGAKELPGPQSLALAIRDYTTGDRSNSQEILNRIDRDKSQRHAPLLAKFGYIHNKEGDDDDTRVYIFPNGQRVTIDSDASKKKAGIFGKREHVTLPVTYTIYTAITPFGPKQFRIDNPQVLGYIENLIAQNLVLTGKNIDELKPGGVTEKQEIKSLSDRGGSQSEGLKNHYPNRTEFQIGGIYFKATEIIQNPTSEDLITAAKANGM